MHVCAELSSFHDQALRSRLLPFCPEPPQSGPGCASFGGTPPLSLLPAGSRAQAAASLSFTLQKEKGLFLVNSPSQTRVFCIFILFSCWGRYKAVKPMTGNRSEPKGSWAGWGAEAAGSSEEWLRGTWGRGQWDRKAQEVGKTAASEEGSDQVRVADRIVFSERFFHHLWCYLCIPLKLQTLMFLSWRCWTETIHFQDQGTQNFPNEAALDLCVSWNRRPRRAMRSSCLEEIVVILLGNDLIFLIIFRNVMATLSSWNFRSSVHFCFPSHSPSLFLLLPSNHSSSSPVFFYFFLSPITRKTVISGFKGKAFHMGHSQNVELFAYFASGIKQALALTSFLKWKTSIWCDDNVQQWEMKCCYAF